MLSGPPSRLTWTEFTHSTPHIQVRPIVFTREEFKTAANTFTQTGFTDPHRISVTKILGVRVAYVWNILSVVTTCHAYPMGLN